MIEGLQRLPLNTQGSVPYLDSICNQCGFWSWTLTVILSTQRL